MISSNMSPRRIVLTAMVMLVVAIAGCQKKTEVAGSAVAAELTPLEKEFGVKWPTNAILEHAAKWRFDGALDGGSHNVETVARLSIPISEFTKWREMSTNALQQFDWYDVVVEPRLTNQYAWWDLHLVPRNRVKRFGKEVKTSNRLAQLDVYVAESNGVATFYIQSYISKP